MKSAGNDWMSLDDLWLVGSSTFHTWSVKIWVCVLAITLCFRLLMRNCVFFIFILGERDEAVLNTSGRYK